METVILDNKHVRPLAQNAINVVEKTILQKCAACKAPLLKSTAKLTAFRGHRLHTCGKAIIPYTYSTMEISA